ncbi:uncharacterized protein LOC108161433 isoform X1 [Drosophila miranda]|uniref:uncharacterized protein LOC108161433 isoform X1 n=2 Tax=Drosophila miranda TaxID=7229 RepID=UPI0007E88716|nr:uncharacterized protein LOC108161433 isoform X1 [Drosophila miranda]
MYLYIHIFVILKSKLNPKNFDCGMVFIKEWCRQIICLFRHNHDTLSKCTIMFVMLVGILDYSYVKSNCDLLWWKKQLTDPKVGPMFALLYIVTFKVSLILFMTFWSYTKKIDREQEKNDTPISEVKRRYRRFIMMRLLKAFNVLVEERNLLNLSHSGNVKKRFLKKHSKFIKEVELFRWNARKLYERTDNHLFLPLHQVLTVDDELEYQLLQSGYGDRLTMLRDVEIHQMVYGYQ